MTSRALPFAAKVKHETAKGDTAPEYAKDYRERAKAEQDRRKLATCVDFYSVVCFKTDDELKRFKDSVLSSTLSWGGGGVYYKGEDFAEALERAGFGRTAKRSVPKKPVTYRPSLPNPCAENETKYTGVMEHDIYLDFMAIYKAFIEWPAVEPVRHVFDSPHWLCAVFKSGDDLRDFIASHGLSRYTDGVRNLDGSAMLKRICI